MNNILTGRKILVTGGTGSFGQCLVRNMLEYDPEVIRIFSRDETRQAEMRKELADFKNLRFLIGDIRDRERVRQAFDGIDVVYHVAGLKHVGSCEYNPFETMKTNILGTQNVIDAALEDEVERVIFTSTDKAVNPSNTMGASKLFAERLMTAANFCKGKHKTILASVRFGNVLGSRGSVIPLFRKQIADGGPITITDGDMTRFVMSAVDAVDIVFKATKMACGGEVFIFKMPSVKLLDLAEVMVEELAPKRGHRPEDIEMKFTGVIPGEKFHEDLMTEEEVGRALEAEEMFIVKPAFQFVTTDYEYGESTTLAVAGAHSSQSQELLSKEGIRELLKRGNHLD